MISFHLRLCIAFLLTLTLTILPLPAFLVGFRPPWVLLLSVYLQCYLPNHFKIGILFILGLILDALLSTTLGEHVFALFLISWIINNKARRFHFFPMGQQMAFIGICCLIYQFTLYCVEIFQGFSPSILPILSSSLISTVLWPWFRLLTEDTLVIRIRSTS